MMNGMLISEDNRKFHVKLEFGYYTSSAGLRVSDCLVDITNPKTGSVLELDGTTTCNASDRYDKKVGRKIALRRAIQGLHKLVRKQIWDIYFFNPFNMEIEVIYVPEDELPFQVTMTGIDGTKSVQSAATTLSGAIHRAFSVGRILRADSDEELRDYIVRNCPKTIVWGVIVGSLDRHMHLERL